MQERWGVFLNVPEAAARFSAQTGIEVEVQLLELQEMWDAMHASFEDDDPPFDLVGVDELLLVSAGRRGRVEPLDSYLAADGYALDDFLRATVGAASDGGSLLGLPYAAVSNVLIYRADLLERFSLSVPRTMSELADVAAAVQAGVRAEGDTTFSGLALRGAPGCGLNYWLYGSSWAPAWGASNVDQAGGLLLDSEAHVAALEHYLHLQGSVTPPRPWEMGFIEAMSAYRDGRVAMVIEPANEASLLYDHGGEIADATSTALVPGGADAKPHPGLYTPPYAIPARSPHKQEAWELAKFLCSAEQVTEDALMSGFVEVARESVFQSSPFRERFRPELLETVTETRSVAVGERPVTDHGMAVGDALGDEVARALRGEVSARAALETVSARFAGVKLPALAAIARQ